MIKQMSDEIIAEVEKNGPYVYSGDDIPKLQEETVLSLGELSCRRYDFVIPTAGEFL